LIDATVIIAARMGSSRLPGKAMLPLNSLPMLAFLIRRLMTTRIAKRIVLATTERPEDDILAIWAEREGAGVFRGSEDDVMARYVDTADRFGGDYIVRVTADCPLVDSSTLDYCLENLESKVPFDLATTKGLWAKGIDYEIYRASAMKEIYHHGNPSTEDREHLTLFFYRYKKSFNIVEINPPEGLERDGLVFTVDTKEDYEYINGLFYPEDGYALPVRKLIERAKIDSQLLKTVS